MPSEVPDDDGTAAAVASEGDAVGEPLPGCTFGGGLGCIRRYQRCEVTVLFLRPTRSGSSGLLPLASSPSYRNAGLHLEIRHFLPFFPFPSTFPPHPVRSREKQIRQHVALWIRQLDLASRPGIRGQVTPSSPLSPPLSFSTSSVLIPLFSNGMSVWVWQLQPHMVPLSIEPDPDHRPCSALFHN